MRPPFSPCFAVVIVVVGMGIPGFSLAGPPEEPTPEPTQSPREQLASYAKGKRLVQPGDEPSGAVVITDEDVERLGYSDAGAPQPAKSGDETETPAHPMDEPSRRTIWRQRIADQYIAIEALRERLHNTEQRLETEWNAFYACDEPGVRENRIRPELVTTIAEADQAEALLDAAEAELEVLIDEAREAGAQPGWFRGLQGSSGPIVIGRPR